MEKEVFDVRLKHDSTLVVCGPSNSGKTEIVKRLILHRNAMIDHPPKRVVWFYGIYQVSLVSFAEEHNIVMHRGIPPDLESFIKPYDMVIYDDLQTEGRNSDSITSVFTKYSHHMPCFSIFLVQHLFYKSKDSSTRSLSTCYLIYMKSVRGFRQISVLGSQVSFRSNFLSNVYAHVTRQPYSYLFMDWRSETPDAIRVRTNIFPDDGYQSTYLTNVG